MTKAVPILGKRDRSRTRQAYDNHASRAADKRFCASAEWLKLRRYKLAQGPLCEACKAQGRVTAAVHVHHRLPRKQRPDLALSYDNLESLCQPCHNAKGSAGGLR